MDAEIKRLTETNSRVAQYLESLSGSSLSNHLQGNLREDLFRPTSRLMKYQVIFKVTTCHTFFLLLEGDRQSDRFFVQNILEKTPVGHVDHEDLVCAYDAVVRLISEVNEEKRAKEIQDRVAHLFTIIDFGSPAAEAFAQKSFTEKAQPDLQEVAVSSIEMSGIKAKKKKPVHVVVAGELVLFLVRLPEASSSGGKLYKLLSPPTRLEHVSSVDIVDETEDKLEFKDMFEVRVTEPEPLLLFFQTASRREKAILMETLGNTAVFWVHVLICDLTSHFP